MTLEPFIPITLEPPLVLTTEDARAYVGFTAEMWQEAVGMGLIKRLPHHGPRRSNLYAKVQLLEEAQRYLDFLSAKSGKSQ